MFLVILLLWDNLHIFIFILQATFEWRTFVAGVRPLGKPDATFVNAKEPLWYESSRQKERERERVCSRNGGVCFCKSRTTRGHAGSADQLFFLGYALVIKPTDDVDLVTPALYTPRWNRTAPAALLQLFRIISRGRLVIFQTCSRTDHRDIRFFLFCHEVLQEVC